MTVIHTDEFRRLDSVLSGESHAYCTLHAWLNLPRLKEFSMSNDCGKTGKAVAGAETGGETGGWRRGCRGKTRAVRCPPTPLAPSASVRSIAGWVCGVCGVCGVYGVYGGSVPLSFCLGSPALIPLSPPCASLLP